MESYDKFLANKLSFNQPSGFEVNPKHINKNLFDWQEVLVKWSLLKGKSALFEMTGLGKTLQELSWAYAVHKYTKAPVIGYAPLAVSHQTVREGAKFGIKVHRCKDKDDIKDGINITNYERIDKFDHSIFGGAFLDESSRIKDDTAQFTNAVIEAHIKIPYRLCASATPSPNDYTELGNTAEYLGIMTRSEMLSMFFINDSGDTTASWRLKGHVMGNRFWEWLSSWCVMIRKPSDIGYSDEGYILPKLHYHEHIIPYTGKKKSFFVEDAKGLSEIRESMRETLEDRCKLASDIVNKDKKIWAAWCNLNPEGDKLTELIDGAVQVAGSTKDDLKVKRLMDFANSKIKCLVTKPKIAGHGLNFQNCCNIVVTGLSHSFEQFFQLVRRFHRFGQKKEVHVHIIYGQREGSVLKTIKRKEKQMIDMFDAMIIHMKKLMQMEIKKASRKDEDYNPKQNMELPKFLKG